MAFVPLAASNFIVHRNQFNNVTSTRPWPHSARQTPRATLRKAKEITPDELERVLNENARPLVVDAFAKWCGPCQHLMPHLDTVADKYGDRLDVLKLDTERYPDMASALLIRGLPTLFFIKDGKCQHRMEGTLNAPELEKLIEHVLFDGPKFDAPDYTS